MEIKEIVVETDIINDPVVQEIRAAGVLPTQEDQQQQQQLLGLDHYSKKKRAALGEPDRKWPEKRIPYTFHSGISEKSKSIPSRKTESSYLNFSSDN